GSWSDRGTALVTGVRVAAVPAVLARLRGRRSFLVDPAATDASALSLHDALPISVQAGTTALATVAGEPGLARSCPAARPRSSGRSEEHTSELQSREKLVCRLLLEKKKRSSSSARAGCTTTDPRRSSGPWTPLRKP